MEKTLIFDIIINTHRGALYCLRLQRPHVDVASPTVHGVRRAGLRKPISADEAHRLLGHMGPDATRAVAAHLGWKIKPGKQTTCEACALAKAKQKNINKEVDAAKKASAPNGRWYSDLSLIKAPAGSGIVVPRPNWHLITDEYSGLKRSAFYKTKADLVESMCEQLNKARERGRSVAVLRQDNAGENKAVEARCQSSDWQLDVTFEYTARSTLQQNSHVETGFTVVAARARAMMGAANIPVMYRFLFF